MIQKASNEVGFEAEDIPLMVEAIPLNVLTNSLIEWIFFLFFEFGLLKM